MHILREIVYINVHITVENIKYKCANEIQMANNNARKEYILNVNFLFYYY